jgi:hypothetical protein
MLKVYQIEKVKRWTTASLHQEKIRQLVRLVTDPKTEFFMQSGNQLPGNSLKSFNFSSRKHLSRDRIVQKRT